MRELDRNHRPPDAPSKATEAPASGEASLPAVRRRVAVVGNGRAGRLLAAALADAGHGVVGPLGRGGVPPAQIDAVLLCVGDAEIGRAASEVPPGVLTGHCCGAHGVELIDRPRAFAMHPLMTITHDTPVSRLSGAWAAVDGSDPDALDLATQLAEDLDMIPVHIAPDDRAAYHAAASFASNFLITIEACAERLGAQAGLPREALVPLVRATVDNWAAVGSEAALTGPIARGDTGTVVRQRAAIEGCAPDLVVLFDEICRATRDLAATGVKA